MEKNEIKDILIKVEGLKKIYSDDRVPVEALRGVDLTLKQSEFTAIVGPSGSGKTTLLNIMSGLDRATEGKVWLKGRLISEMSDKELSDFRRDNLGFIFQAYNLIPVLTVEENVEYIMLLQKISKNERRRRVEKILKELGLEGYIKRRPPQLSGGQQQRVAVARAMVSRPSLILADEPTANLDSETGGGLLDMMRELNQKTGMTYIFSTHDENVMKRACRLIILKDGRVASDETRES
ncbi:MAG: ABC transporter ATP-binding protein [Acidobacteriota bacterium]